MTPANQFARVLDMVTYDATVSALAAVKEVYVMTEHIRRSIGQKVRWQIARSRK